MNLIGQTIAGRYQILAEIGRGGMGVVYRASQPSLNRDVALKVLSPYLAHDRQFVARFAREAQTAARLHHPNIVTIYDVGQDGDTYFIAMQLLNGQPLSSVLQQTRPLPPPRAAYILAQIAEALDYAHRQGLVHRDVKPANIIIGPDDHATLTDFGIARGMDGPRITLTGEVIGTPEYMAPEQVKGQPATPATDLYALGVMAFEMFTGVLPHRGTTPHAILHGIVYEPPPNPRSINPQVAPATEHVLLRALAKEPGQRFGSGREFASALQGTPPGRTVATSQQQVAVPTRQSPPKTTAGMTNQGLATGTSIRQRPGTGTPRSQQAATGVPVHRQSPNLAALWAGAVVILAVLILGALSLNQGRQASSARVTTTDVPTGREVSNASNGVVMATEQALAATMTSLDKVRKAGTRTAIAGQATTVAASVTALAKEQAAATAAVVAQATQASRATTEAQTIARTAVTRAATQTAVASSYCSRSVDGSFAGVYDRYGMKNDLGCPVNASHSSWSAFETFDRGIMFWREDRKEIYALSNDGRWSEHADQWRESIGDWSCPGSAPTKSPPTPIRGFGWVWCNAQGVRDRLGWATDVERGDKRVIQDFQNGIMFVVEGRVYALYRDGYSWRQF